MTEAQVLPFVLRHQTLVHPTGQITLGKLPTSFAILSRGILRLYTAQVRGN